MSIVTTVTSNNKQSATVLVNRKPTVKARLEKFLNALAEKCIEHGYNDEGVDTLMELGTALIEQQSPASKKEAFKGWFFELFGKEPVTGTTITCEDVVARSDGRFAFTKRIIDQWADPLKGVPYGRGMTAVIRFNRRYMEENGDIIPASYTLLSTAPATPEWEKMARAGKARKQQVVIPLTGEEIDENIRREAARIRAAFEALGGDNN